MPRRARWSGLRPASGLSPREIPPQSSRTRPTIVLSVVRFGLLLAAKIDFDDALVVLNLVHGAFTQNGALVKHRHLACELTNESHIVFDDNDAVLAHETQEQLAGSVGFLVGHAGGGF